MEPSQDYKRTKTRFLRTGTLYEDPDFPLSREVQGVPYTSTYPIKWMRPTELMHDPLFILDGISRSDIHQGALKDCYLIAAVACLSVTSPELLSRVIPPNQSFQKDYTGLFYFNFWQDDAWVEVWVDDRIPIVEGEPVFAHNRTPGEQNEFWMSLMEKAYAKLKGGYHNLTGGYINEAMAELTGGISERIMITDKRAQLAPTLYDLLLKTSQMTSLLGCSIESDKLEEEDMGNGLFGGHAYSITSLAKVAYKGETVKLIRLRNPWGYNEWTGAWGDKSVEWRHVPDDVKLLLEYKMEHDGEFWMSFEDWLREFDEVAFCHVTPSAFLRELAPFSNAKQWKELRFHGRWIKGVSAGGCGNKEFGEDFHWTNPQYPISIPKGREDTTVVISLSQRTSKTDDNHYISFKIYKVKLGHLKQSTESYIRQDLDIVERPENYMNVGELSGHFVLSESGHYIIIPSTYEPGKEGDFVLRMFVEDYSSVK